jgi:hypothetical protein
MCGDSTSAVDTRRALGGMIPRLCLTDPPYGIDGTTSEKNRYEGYSDTRDELVRLVAGFLPIARQLAEHVVITPGNGNSRLYPDPMWTMAWFTPAGVGSGPWGFCCWQPILCYGKDPKLVSGKGRHPDAVVHTEAAEKTAHPCPKPLRFWGWLMERTSEVGDVILDPFSGSGTTIVAGETLGRRVCALDISPQYVDLAVRRWQLFTGGAAIREADGMPFP